MSTQQAPAPVAGDQAGFPPPAAATGPAPQTSSVGDAAAAPLLRPVDRPHAPAWRLDEQEARP